MIKRFYKEVAVALQAGGLAVTLDGRPIKTPAKAALVVPARALAEAVAEEWRAQGDEVRPREMPMTRLASTAIDRVARHRVEIVDAVAAYGAGDVVCYYAERPAELVARQQAAWQPLLDWLERCHGARLAVTAGIVHVGQSEAALERLRRLADGFDDFPLAALQSATAAAGSVVIALALLAGEIDAAAAFGASRVDETFQIERWGEDAEAAEARAALARDLADAARFVALLGK